MCIRDRLKQAGLNDQDLQELKNSGQLKQIRTQIREQGGVDKWLQSEKGKQAMQQIGAQGRVDVSKIKAQGKIDESLQDTKGEQALQQIGAQGDVEESLQDLKGDQAIQQLQQAGLNDQDSQKSTQTHPCLLYTSPSPRDRTRSRMPSSA